MKITRSFMGISNPYHKLMLLAGDLCCIAIAFYITAKNRLHSMPDIFSLEYLGLNFIIIGCLFIGGGYTNQTHINSPKLPLRTFFIVMASVIPATIFIYFSGPERFTALFGRGIFPFAMITVGFLAVLSRYLINTIYNDTSQARKIVLLGEQNTRIPIFEALNELQVNIELIHIKSGVDTENFGSRLSAIVTLPQFLPTQKDQKALINYRLAGVPIFSLSDFYESLFFYVPVEHIDDNWLIQADGFNILHNSSSNRAKRVVDLGAACSLLILTLPVCIVTAILIKLTSKGPIFFSQNRTGLKGKQFTLTKFRSMSIDAESDGAQWAAENDPRVFPLGRFLRKSRIDELPQCWNIIKGEMSFIGPRPERPEFTLTLVQDIAYYDLRHLVKPGPYRLGASHVSLWGFKRRCIKKITIRFVLY